MYKCQRCGEKAEVQGKQDIDINCNTPFISEWVVCPECQYTILKDTADKEVLLDAAREIVQDFNQYGAVLRVGDNGDYGTESPIGTLAAAVELANK